MMRLYRALLHLYPAAFRAEYGEEICGIFAQRRLEASRAPAALALWVESFFDVLVNSARVHRDILAQDLHYTARVLRRAPGFALTAILVVALGVGANTAAFTITDHVLIRPLPFAEPERLVKLWERQPGYTPRQGKSSCGWQRVTNILLGLGDGGLPSDARLEASGVVAGVS